MKPSLTVWVISDGRPGHFNQSKGMLKSLSLRYAVQAEWIDVRLRVGAFRRLLRYWLNSTSAPLPDSLVRLCYRLPKRPGSPPDVILSAGGKTSFLNVALSRQYGSPNIFAGSLRGLSDRHFRTVFTLEPVPNATNNVVLEHIPTTIDPQTVTAKGRELREQRKLGDERLWTMVIGGDGAGYRYSTADWTRLAQAMNELSKRHAIRWLVISSPRTGTSGEQQLRASIDPDTIADAVWFQSDERRLMQAYLGASDVIFCTEDSMSMLTEAICAGRPTIALSPASYSPETRFTEALDRMVDADRMRRISIASLREAMITENWLSDFRPMTQSPAEMLLPHLLAAMGVGEQESSESGRRAA